MSRLVFDLESILQQLIVEHRKLLKHVDAHQAAMKTMALDAMDQAANQQEASRLRIVTMENTRRTIVAQLAQQNRDQWGNHHPAARQALSAARDDLLKLRDELKKTILQVQARSHIAGRLAGSLLGHLNTVVRLIVGAVERAGVYTKTACRRFRQGSA